MSWTREREEKLRQYWKKGHSGSQIASMLGDGATRNSVLGKAFRLKLEARTPSKKLVDKTNIKKNNSPEIKTQKLSKKARFRALLLDRNFPPENRIYDVSKLEDGKHCRYPTNHPGNKDFYYCGRKPLDNHVYCQLHIMLCFTPKNPKEEDLITEEDIPQTFIQKNKSA